MNKKIKIVALSGSTRKASSNLNLIKAIAKLTVKTFDIKIFSGLLDLPHFNADLDNENTPQKVKDFRKELSEADAILICTPEYAIGVPGTLKNAIDWTISSMNFSKKPVALITASLSGAIAHKSLLGTLLIIEARITAGTQLLISFVQTKVNADAVITDEKTLQSVNHLIHSLTEIIGEKDVEYLSAPILI